MPGEDDWLEAAYEDRYEIDHDNELEDESGPWEDDDYDRD
jgi:hypothetical protein